MTDTSLTKSARARALGCARSTLYYEKKQPERDWQMKCAIEEVLRHHQSYGHRRIATALGRKDERPVLRVMKLFGIKAYRRRGRRWRKAKIHTTEYPNLLMIRTPSRMHDAWVADFTYIGWKGTTVYLATVMDVYTRTVLGVSILTTYSATTTGADVKNLLLGNVVLSNDQHSVCDCRKWCRIGRCFQNNKPKIIRISIFPSPLFLPES